MEYYTDRYHETVQFCPPSGAATTLGYNRKLPLIRWKVLLFILLLHVHLHPDLIFIQETFGDFNRLSKGTNGGETSGGCEYPFDDLCEDLQDEVRVQVQVHDEDEV